MAIRPDTDPKSASPRSGTPKGELEQYGVWVKAEPQDIIEEVAAPGAGDMDFDLPGDAASLPEESFLSEDEEKLLGSFDSDFEAGSAEESGPLPDIEDMPPLEDSLLAPEPSPLIEDIEDMGAGSIDISLEDIESARPTSPIHPGADIDMDSVQGLDSPSGAIEDVSSEFLGPADGPSSAEFGSELDDVTSEFLDVEEPAPRPRAQAPADDFEPLDIDLHFDDSADAASGRDPAEPEPGFETVTEFDDFLAADEPAQVASQDSAVGDFDDVSAVERELAAPVARSAPAGEAARQADSSSLSNDLLMKIAQELSSIRGELVSLKSQIGEAMLAPELAPPRSSEQSEAEDDESGPSGGFFDEEEDETIALTGDELDNILNTADFTEEIAETEELTDLESEGLELESGSPSDEGLLDETLLPESGDYSSFSPALEEADTAASEPAIEEVRLGEADSVDEIGLEAAETEDLDLVAEEGLLPMTPAPEDSSYLETVEELDLGAPLGEGPLTDGPLVEPDLSEFDLEPEELEESRLEIDEELPLATTEPELEELTLGIEAGPGYAAEESVVEAEPVEPVQEIEEPNFAEINLHEEDLADASSSEPSDLEEIEFLPDSDLGASFASEPQRGPSQAEPPIEEEDLVLAAEEEPAPEAFAAATPRTQPAPSPSAREAPKKPSGDDGDRLKSEIKSVLSYLDKLLDSLPEDKIEEFARSEYFDTYKKLFEELGLV